MKKQVLAVQKMQDYMEENLEKEISLSDLARVSTYSPWYSHRLFREYTGYSPAEYLRRLRLSRSALCLKQGDTRVIDVAFDLGFGSVDGYQRAFRKEFGCNPGEYARTKLPIPLFIPYGVKFKEIRKENYSMETVQSVFVQLMRKPERKAIIKRGIEAEDYFSYCEEVGCDVWGMRTSMDSLCGEPVCLWLTEEDIKPGTSTYVQGVEVDRDYDGPVPQGFDVITLPEAEYLIFQGEPFLEENYCSAIDAVQIAADKYDPSLIQYQWDDRNPRIQLEPRGERGYIELRAVRPLSEKKNDE